MLRAAVLIGTLIPIVLLWVIHAILAAVPLTVRVTADAGWGADGAVCGGGWRGHRGRTEALACVCKAGSCGCSFGESWGCKICKVRRGGWRERSRREGGERGWARGAVPGSSRCRVPVVLLVDAVKDVTYRRRSLGRHFELAVA